ncbi:hypothetical protein ABKN59_011862, partial [Abortiporus biennis]
MRPISEWISQSCMFIWHFMHGIKSYVGLEQVPGSISASTRACHDNLRSRESGVRLPAREQKVYLLPLLPFCPGSTWLKICWYRAFAINPRRNHINRVPLKHGDLKEMVRGSCIDRHFLNTPNSLCATAHIVQVSVGSNSEVQVQRRYIPVVHSHLRTRDPRNYVDSFYYPHVERRGSALSRLGGSRQNDHNHNHNNNNNNNDPNKTNGPKGREKTKKEKLKESFKKFGNSFLEPDLIPSLEEERRIVAMAKLEELTTPQGHSNSLNSGLNHSTKPPPSGGSGSGSASTNTGRNGRGGGRIHKKRRDGNSLAPRWNSGFDE